MKRSNLLPFFITIAFDRILVLIGLLFCCQPVWAEIPIDTLVGAWLFDQNQGLVAKDATGNGHDGVIKGPKWVKGKHKFGLKFDGKDDVVEIPHHKDLTLGQYTIVAWIKPVANGKWRTVVGKEPAETPRSFGVYLGGNDNTLGVNFTQGNKWKSAIGKTPTAEGKWNHVAATYDGEKLRAYLDGQLEAETNVGGAPDPNKAPMRIGRWGGARGDYMEGLIDEVAIFNKALEGKEVQQIVKTSLTQELSVELSNQLVLRWAQIKLNSIRLH